MFMAYVYAYAYASMCLCDWQQVFYIRIISSFQRFIGYTPSPPPLRTMGLVICCRFSMHQLRVLRLCAVFSTHILCNENAVAHLLIPFSLNLNSHEKSAPINWLHLIIVFIWIFRANGTELRHWKNREKTHATCSHTKAFASIAIHRGEYKSKKKSARG